MWRNRLIDNVYLDTSLLDKDGLDYVDRVLKDLEIAPKISSRVPDKEVPGKNSSLPL